MRTKRLSTLAIFLLAFSYRVCSQSCFKDVVLFVDTLQFSQQKNTITQKTDKLLAFEYFREDEVCELRFYPALPIETIQKIQLGFSKDYKIIDSVQKKENYFKLKIQFLNLNQSKFISLSLTLFQIPLKETTCEIRLQPFFTNKVGFYPKDDELFIGEERVFELVSNNAANIRVNPIFTENKDINYRTEYSGKQLKLYVMPSKLGDMELQLELYTINPYLDEKGHLKYQLPVIRNKFRIKASRLGFLSTEPKEITLEERTQQEGIEIQLDYTRLLTLQKTYRVEDKELPGGRLIAEIFTKSLLSNGKIVCLLRPYGFHRLATGYLYIKNGDEPVCLTNFNVIPKLSIQAISVLHEGNRQETVLYPGETVEIRLDGQALHKASFNFEGLINLKSDSLIGNENTQIFRLQVPMDIAKKEIEIYNGNEKVGKSITVSEHQKSHDFGFVNLNYGAGKTSLTKLPQVVLYPQIVRDIEISFEADKIDDNKKIYGKQYLSVDITVFNARGDLVEIKRINNILICPNETSPRASFYIDKLCNKAPLTLNTILGRKTYDLDAWSKIELVFSHDKDKYSGDGFVKKIEIILQRKMKFDTEVSFPGGLLIKRGDRENFSPFGGISLAIIQQLSFYDPNKINRYRPYKVGMGILANNAFNFNANATNRDIGVVLLGSLYPTRKDAKLSFPLFAGGGYFLSSKAWFFLIGPGIFVSF